MRKILILVSALCVTVSGLLMVVSAQDDITPEQRAAQRRKLKPEKGCAAHQAVAAGADDVHANPIHLDLLRRSKQYFGQ